MIPRSKFDIMKDILVEAGPRGLKNPEKIDGAYKLNIMEGTCLSFSLLQKYLTQLKDFSLIKQEMNRKFKTTDKGLEFLEHYHGLQECLKKD